MAIFGKSQNCYRPPELHWMNSLCKSSSTNQMKRWHQSFLKTAWYQQKDLGCRKQRRCHHMTIIFGQRGYKCALDKMTPLIFFLFLFLFFWGRSWKVSTWNLLKTVHLPLESFFVSGSNNLFPRKPCNTSRMMEQDWCDGYYSGGTFQSAHIHQSITPMHGRNASASYSHLIYCAR